MFGWQLVLLISAQLRPLLLTGFLTLNANTRQLGPMSKRKRRRLRRCRSSADLLEGSGPCHGYAAARQSLWSSPCCW